MKIYFARHGQTELNRCHLIQGSTDEPLNETGIAQAREARKQLEGIHFDAVYSSPLCRAVKTAEILGNVERDRIIIDPRITEYRFGQFEKKKYYALGLRMSLFWRHPERFSPPAGVETIPEMVARSASFLEDLKKQPYDTVLVVCHGGVLRALYGVLEDRPMGIKWSPKPKNSEIRVYET